MQVSDYLFWVFNIFIFISELYYLSFDVERSNLKSVYGNKMFPKSITNSITIGTIILDLPLPQTSRKLRAYKTEVGY